MMTIIHTTKLANFLKRVLGGSLLLLLFCGGIALGNSPKVTVKLHQNRTSLEEPVTLMIRIEGSREAPEVVPEESSEVILTPRGQSTSVQIINGVQSMHQDLYYAVFPQREGTLTIPPLELRFPSGARVRTEPLSLEVLPLPAWKEVPPFSGLVGSGDMRCLIHPREGKTGEPRKLTVLVRGRGNMRDLQPPELLLPGEIKVYEEPVEESLRPGVKGYEGIRAFSWSLIPLREGSWDLPPVQLALFNPEIGGYQVMEAPIPSFSAQGPPLSEGMGTVDTQEPSPFPEEPPGEKKEESREIPLRDPEKKALGDLLPLPSPEFFLVFFLLPPLLAGCGEGIRRFFRGRKTPQYRMIRRSRRALREARRARNPEDMLAWLHKALTWGIFARLRREGELLTQDLLQSLEGNELGSQEVQEAARFLTRLEKMLYGEGEKGKPSLKRISEKPSTSSESKESLESFERDLTDFVRRLWR